MGGCDFTAIGFGKTAEDAFSQAREDAAWERGHGGYTGTIAEKGEFVQFDLKPRTNPYDVDRKLWDARQAFHYEQDPDGPYSHKPSAAERNALKWMRERVLCRTIRRDRYARMGRSVWIDTGYRAPSDPVEHLFATYGDKWGPAVCLEVTGKRAADLKAQHGRKGTHAKVFFFFGIASC